MAILRALGLDDGFDFCVLGKRLLPLLDRPVFLLQVFVVNGCLLLEYTLGHLDVLAVYLQSLLLLVSEVQAPFPLTHRSFVVVAHFEVLLVVVAATLHVDLV